MQVPPFLFLLVPALFPCNTFSLVSLPALPAHMLVDHAELEAGIWEDDVNVVDQGGEISSWLSSFVGRNLRLVGMSDKYERTSSRRFTPRRSFGKTAFSDGYPLLLISEVLPLAPSSELPHPC